MTRNFFIRAVLVTLVATSAHAQVSLSRKVPVAPSVAGMQNPQQMLAAYQAAEAAARRPGDDKLSCEQLEEQLGETMNDPQLQSSIQTAGEKAQQDVAAVEAAKGEVAAQTAATIASSVVPGAAMPVFVASAAASQGKVAEGAQRMQQQMASAQQMTANLPTMMRGERIMQLALAKNCEWAAGMMDADAATP